MKNSKVKISLMAFSGSSDDNQILDYSINLDLSNSKNPSAFIKRIVNRKVNESIDKGSEEIIIYVTELADQ